VQASKVVMDTRECCASLLYLVEWALFVLCRLEVYFLYIFQGFQVSAQWRCWAMAPTTPRPTSSKPTVSVMTSYTVQIGYF
jgi:hypothetical protein